MADDWKSEWRVMHENGDESAPMLLAERDNVTVWHVDADGDVQVVIDTREGSIHVHVPIDLLRELVREHDERRSDG